MSAGYTKLTVEIERNGDVSRATVAGDLDHDSAPGLQLELDKAAGDGVRNIELDLSAVTFIDSAALQVFVSLTDRLGDRGGALSITEASPVVARILKVTRLDELFGQ